MTARAFDERMTESGGINFAKSKIQCDVCVCGMFLAYAAYFCPDERRVGKLADFILACQNEDGGFGWDTQARISDPHTTICVLEGLLSVKENASACYGPDAESAAKRAAEYFLERRLLSGEDRLYRKLSYPFRYRYDLLRALEYFVKAGYPYDGRMAPALDWLAARRGGDGLWPLENRHKGREHLLMEEIGRPSRFITLKALVILRRFRPDVLEE
jgi:hypothetical protein